MGNVLNKMLKGKTLPQLESEGEDLSKLDLTLPEFFLRFGIEVEGVTNLAKRFMAERLKKAGFEVETLSYDASTRTFENWVLTHDGSIDLQNKFDEKVEVCSPVLQGEKGLLEVRDFLAAIRSEKLMTANGVLKTNKSCGLHVHIDINTILENTNDPDIVLKLFTVYTFYQENINKMLAVSRRKNRYCEIITDPEKHAKSTAYKHYVLRITDAGTVEFRQHQGTTNADKVIMWLYFIQLLVTTASKIKSEEDLYDNGKPIEFTKILSEVPILLDYFNRRLRFFSRKKKDLVEIDG